jgi:hypothetical protein
MLVQRGDPRNRAIVLIGNTNFPISSDYPGPDRWKEKFGMCAADAVRAFLDGWERVRYPKGWDPLNLAIARARRRPFSVEGAVVPGYAEFVNIAFQLQYAMGDQPILLPTRLLAEKLGVAPMTISRYRNRALDQDWLKVVRHHKHNPAGRGCATQFRFNLDKVKSATGT